MFTTISGQCMRLCCSKGATSKGGYPIFRISRALGLCSSCVPSRQPVQQGRSCWHILPFDTHASRGVRARQQAPHHQPVSRHRLKITWGMSLSWLEPGSNKKTDSMRRHTAHLCSTTASNGTSFPTLGLSDSTSTPTLPRCSSTSLGRPSPALLLAAPGPAPALLLLLPSSPSSPACQGSGSRDQHQAEGSAASEGVTWAA